MARDLEHPLFRRDEGPVAKVLLLGLWLLSLLFRAIVRRRRHAGKAKARRVPAKVVSVGGLTVGGAGKTPVAIHLARRLAAEGRRPAVLSRGWGRDHRSRDVVVADGNSVLVDVRASGDEPMLIAQSCPGVPVLVGPDRVPLAQAAIERFGAHTLVLDDGFQHLGLARDLDVVVIDASNPFGNGHLLPRGPLREPLEALADAGLVWLSKVEQANPRQLAWLEAMVRRHSQAPLVRSSYRVVDVLDDAGASLGRGALSGKKVLMLAGLARPLSFAHTLEAMGATVAAHRLLPDHGWLRPMDVEQAKLAMRREGLDAIALTEKDAVRLPDSARKGPFTVVRVEAELVADGEEQLTKVLQAV
ncbi:MAG: tetraacyldisaccharide 4'-kinase [Myxococcales bacterium]